MTKAVTANGGMASSETRCWGLWARDNPLEPSPQPPTPSRETLGCELAAEVLRSSGRLRLRATGASMLPAIWPSDILSVRSHDALEALPGDIVLFGRQGRLVAHRVLQRTASQDGILWVTRGDSAGGNDAPVSSHELLGRVTAIERGSRRLTPHQSVASRLISWILRRSDFATRVLLWVKGWGFWKRD